MTGGTRDARVEFRPDMVAFGEAIVRRRQALGWSRYHLSRLAGMSDPYIRALEMGQGKRVGIEVVVRLSKALGTTTDDMLRDAGLPVESAVPDALRETYESMGLAERRAWLRIGQALVAMQEEYRALQRSPETEGELADEPLAAYDRTLESPGEWSLEES